MDILNCRLTKSDSKITKTFGKQKDGTFHTGCDIAAENIYSVCNAVVINIAKQREGTFIVTAQYNKDKCVRYGNLSRLDVKLGQPIMDGQLVGKAAKSVHFEYCVKYETSKFPFRVGSQTYYKLDPTEVIAGERSLSLSREDKRNYILDNHSNPLGLSREILDEMTTGRGEG